MNHHPDGHPASHGHGHGHEDSDEYEDGNAMAGPLSEIFAVDLTSAHGRCANCGITEPVARLRVYTRAPGLVGRCPHCAHVTLRMTRSPDNAWLDMSGTTTLRIPLTTT
nr:DUF6510 family protein [Streptomyces abyssalis]